MAEEDRPTHLYHCYDKAGELLYIGVSWSAASRFHTHKLDKNWWPRVARIDMQLFPTREMAEAKEKKEIETRNPPFNIQHTESWRREREVSSLQTKAHKQNLKRDQALWEDAARLSQRAGWVGDTPILDSYTCSRVERTIRLLNTRTGQRLKVPIKVVEGNYGSNYVRAMDFELIALGRVNTPNKYPTDADLSKIDDARLYPTEW